MKEKTRKILIMAVMAALIISLMAASLCYAFTYGRYSGGRLDDNSTYDDLIDFVGATAFTVTSPEEFVNAIENGYSYIKIADGAEDPFVINEDIADVYTNLVLDVNGTTVIRNSRNPVLDVRRSISVVLVYDSSEGASGGFYNPVGSALQTSGGSLTIGSGSYESGPNVEGTETLSSTTATVYKRNGSRPDAEDYAFDATVTEMPSLGGDVYYTGDTTQYTYIENDTYLIYTEEENAFVSDGQLYVNAKSTSTTGTDGSQTTTVTGTQLTPICNVASCDFYYYYQIDAGETDNDYDQTYAVVYGYNDVKGLAEDSTDDTTAVDLREKGLAWPYAAIRSVEDGTVGGVTHARGGAFTTNFGTDNTYGIYSVGGTMTVGTDSKSTPPEFTATGEGTCIGMSAGENDTLTIASGNFSSQVGDTILMRGGEMTVTGGTFTKSGNKARPSGGLEAIEASRTALIHMRGGDLTIDGTVTGANYSVTMAAGSEQTPLTNVFGIYSEQSSSGDSGTVSVEGCEISVSGTYSSGVLATNGIVSLSGTTTITVTNSQTTETENYQTISTLTSSAVSSEGGTINLSGTVEIKSDSLGITARGIINVGDETTQAAANVTVNTDNATGVYVNNGKLNVNAGATLDVTSTVKSNTRWVQPPEGQTAIPPSIYNGVYVNGGSLTSNGTLNVDFTGVQSDNVGSGDNRNLDRDTAYRNFQVKSYAVRVEGSNQVDTEGNPIDKVTIAAGTITNDVGGGVLVNGGTVTLGAAVTDDNGTVTRSGPTVSATGTGYYNNTHYAPSDSTAQNWWYYVPSSGGEAVKIVGGTLTIHGGNYSAEQGNGILVNGGTSNIYGGTFIGNDQYHTEGGSNPQAGPGASYAFKVLNGTANVHGGNFTIKEGGTGSGAFVTGSPASDSTAAIYATANIYGGSFVVGFVDENGNVSGGQAGFSVLKYANVKFETSNDSEILVAGNAAGMTVEQTSGSSNATININGGTFKSTDPYRANSDGIWYGNGTTKVNITAGQFTGANRSGLYFNANSWNGTTGNVQIYSGTFIGESGSIAGLVNNNANIDLGYSIQITDIIVCDPERNSDKSIYYIDRINGGNNYNQTLKYYYDENEQLGEAFRNSQNLNATTEHYQRVEIRSTSQTN